VAGLLAAVIAVLGTLAGVATSYFLQGKASARTESNARGERLRQERLAAYSALAGAVMDLRGAQYERAYSRFKSEVQRSDRSAVIAESSRLRSVAWSAFYRFKLTTPDGELTKLAERAVEETVDVSDADDKDDLKRRSEQARKRIDDFTCAAAEYLEATATRPGDRQ
jgi:hypothetical protein